MKQQIEDKNTTKHASRSQMVQQSIFNVFLEMFALPYGFAFHFPNSIINMHVCIMIKRTDETKPKLAINN